jgi:hypothetical protein
MIDRLGGKYRHPLLCHSDRHRAEVLPMALLNTHSARKEKLQASSSSSPSQNCCMVNHCTCRVTALTLTLLNTKLNPICHLLALLAHHILHVGRIRVNDCLSAASSH